MEAGKLDQDIEFLELVETNKSGSLIQNYVVPDDGNYGHDWAEIISERGAEAFQAARTNATQQVRCRVRYRDDVDVKWMMVWDGQKYNIKAIDRSQRRQGWLWFTAEVIGAR